MIMKHWNILFNCLRRAISSCKDLLVFIQIHIELIFLLLLLFNEPKPATFNKAIGNKRIYLEKGHRESSYLFHPELRKTVVVPVHGNKDIPNGTLLSIIKQAGISKEEL